MSRYSSNPRRLGFTLLVGVALVGVVSPGCRPRYPGGGERPANLLLITMDTTRADRLGCYGYAAAETPNLDRLAAEGVLATRSIAVAPMTLPSHASLLTGLYPPEHGARDNADFVLPPAARTLAEHLKDQSYATAAAVGAYVLSSDFGIDQGFDAYDEPREPPDGQAWGAEVGHRPIVERPAAAVTDAALAALRTRLPEPFFLWIHYFDPHQEYSPPPPFSGRFAARPYDGEIAYMDEQIGRLLDGLRARGVDGRTLTVATADHGESLGEHGETTHGLFVYDATQRVPLILRWPGEIPSGLSIDRVVAGVDLVPTVLELLGLPAMGGVRGASAARAVRGDPMPPREPVFCEAVHPALAYGWAPLRALTDETRKFIDAPEPELYDLRADPRELRNLAAVGSTEVDDWRSRMEDLTASWPEGDPDANRALDLEARARLASLGYLSTGPGGVVGVPGADPKRLVEVHNRLLEIQSRLVAGERGALVEPLESVLKRDPANPMALGLSGVLLCATGRCEAGLPRLEEAARRAPRSYEIHRNLANALHLAGRLAEAAEAYRAAIELQPFSAEDRFGLGNVLHAAGDAPGAARAYEHAIVSGLDSPAVHAALGIALADSGRSDDAERELRVAVELDPGLAEAWNRLGILAEQAGRLEEAAASYERALQLRPDDAGVLFNRAKVALRLGDLETARGGAEHLLAVRPNHPVVRFLLAQIAIARGDDREARDALHRFVEQPDAEPRLVREAREQLERLERDGMEGS